MIAKKFPNSEPGASPWESLRFSSKLWEPYSVADGMRIFREGDVAEALYIVDEGSVRIELERAELDSESVLAQVGVGEVFGGNSTGDNVGFRHLRNIKRLAFYRAPEGKS